jgi:hypothetical protein
MSNFLTEEEIKKLTDEYLRPHFAAGRFDLASLAPGLKEFLNHKAYEKMIQQQNAERQARKEELSPLRETLRRDPRFDGKEINFGLRSCPKFHVKIRDNFELSIIKPPYNVRAPGFETMLVHDTNLLHDTQFFFLQDETDKIAKYILAHYDTLKMTSEDLHKILKQISPKIADFFCIKKKFNGKDVITRPNYFFLDELSAFSKETNFIVCDKRKEKLVMYLRKLREGSN